MLRHNADQIIDKVTVIQHLNLCNNNNNNKICACTCTCSDTIIEFIHKQVFFTFMEQESNSAAIKYLYLSEVSEGAFNFYINWLTENF